MAASGIAVEEPGVESDRACPVCGGTTVDSSMWTCTVCNVGWMHGECYWGRIASLAEWQALVRLLGTDADAAYESAIVCARWTRLLAASRKLHAIVNAEREDLET